MSIKVMPRNLKNSYVDGLIDLIETDFLNLVLFGFDLRHVFFRSHKKVRTFAADLLPDAFLGALERGKPFSASVIGGGIFIELERRFANKALDLLTAPGTELEGVVMNILNELNSPLADVAVAVTGFVFVDRHLSIIQLK